MYPRRFAVTPVSASDGSVIAYTDVGVTGALRSIQYVKAGAANYADGVDFAITSETTGQGLWTEANVNASAIRCPRQATHDSVGVALLYAGGGAAVTDFIYLAGERVKISITNAGDTKTGTFYITVG